MSSVAGVEEANATIMAGAPQLAAEVRRLRERERVLVEALGLYDRWVGECNKDGNEGDAARRMLAKDVGKVARAALEAVKE
jgi:hypothetical protein